MTTFINLSIVAGERKIERGYLSFEGDRIVAIGEGDYKGEGTILDKTGLTAFPGFVDIHIHGSKGIDFMDAEPSDYPIIAKSLLEEGVTTFLATTLTADKESLKRVCLAVKEAKKDVPSLGGIHFEGPYIAEAFKGAQNPDYIRDPSIEEIDELQEASGNNVRYITLAPEKNGAKEFIAHCRKIGVIPSAGHTGASFADVEAAIPFGLSNTTHTHNAMTGHHHRNPGVVTAAMYFDSLYTEVICDTVHVCSNTLKTFYKIVGPERFICVTDALKVKHTDIETFQLFGLDCVRKPDAAYLVSGPLAGSLLTMDQALRNLRNITGASDVELAKITSRNAARSIGFDDRGEIAVGKLADVVLLDKDYQVSEVYLRGKREN